MWKWIAGTVAFFVIVNVASKLVGKPSAARPTVPQIADQVLVRDLNWHSDGFGSVMVIDRVDIVNRNEHAIKDFSIACVVRAPSGTVVSRPMHTVYGRVGANSTETFRNLNMGFINSQAERAACAVFDAKVAQ